MDCKSERSVSMKHNMDVSSEDVVTQNISKCQAFMRKFWKPRQKKCQNFNQDGPFLICHPMKTFPTGSKYHGTWEGPLMNGFGTYVFPNGVKYEGEFRDGMFHGQGELRYPDGVKLKAMWKDGAATDRTVVFCSGLQYEEKDWKYCEAPDRRYKVEYDKGIQPGGASYLTAKQPTKNVPKGLYHTGDGFYLDQYFVYENEDRARILRAPGVKEAKWIKKHCRKGSEGPVGSLPEYYEDWLAPQLKMKPSPPPPVNIESETELVKCMSEFDSEMSFGLSFMNLGISSSSESEGN